MQNRLPDTKPHFIILDGLRGIAAMLVVAFHLMEAHSTSHLDLKMNHGYLAVDFFFLLSGYVIGYAYDDRWGKMTVAGFLKRRLIRLHPMIIIGMLVGALLFYFQASEPFPLIHITPFWKLILTMLIGFTLLPLPVSMDVRGWQEMHPLDGPAWSLFFEYIGNILYALFVRKFSNTALAILVFICGAALIHLAVTSPTGDVIGGWSVTGEQLRIGFTRLLFPFFAGLLLSRVTKPAQIKYAFFISSILLITIFWIPRIGGAEGLWKNGLFDALVIVFAFPLIVYIGASGKPESAAATKVCRFFGDISYPLYITHYPLVYTYFAWVNNNKITFDRALPVAAMVFVLAIVLAYFFMKYYDEPVRKWLSRRYLNKLEK